MPEQKERLAALEANQDNVCKEINDLRDDSKESMRELKDSIEALSLKLDSIGNKIENNRLEVVNKIHETKIESDKRHLNQEIRISKLSVWQKITSSVFLLLLAGSITFTFNRCDSPGKVKAKVNVPVTSSNQ